MDVSFKDNKLRKCANEHRRAQKEMGPLRADKFLKRLTEIQAATCLEDLRHLPQAKFHALTGDRKEQISCALDHPYRLILTPNPLPAPLLEDGGLDWSLITAVTVLEIVDYH